jgi:ubiquitin-like 1-activating enzyme E1 A
MTKRSAEGMLSDEEKARYDRQIRVWGAEAQSRIQNSKVLICGMRGMNMEAIKNIVLAGMSVCVQDAGVVTPADLGCSGFFVGNDDVGKSIVEVATPRIQELNTFAQITSDNRPLELCDDAFFQQFNIVCLANASEQQITRISALCRAASPQKAMFASWAFGAEGVFISDFGHDFQYKDDERPNTEFVPTVKNISFPPIPSVLDMPWSKQQKRYLPLAPAFVKSAILAKWSNGLLKWASGSSDDPAAAGTEAKECNNSSSTSNRRAFLHKAAEEALIANGLPADFLSEKDLDDLLARRNAPTATVCSIMGSFLAQEIVKGVSSVGEPGYNTHIFLMDECSVSLYPMNETMTAPTTRSKVPEAITHTEIDL